MARTFLPQLVYAPSGGLLAPLLDQRGRLVTLYRDEARTQVETAVTVGGVPKPDGKVLVDATSRTPRLVVAGGEEVPTTLYAVPDGSSLATPIYSNAEQALATLEGEIDRFFETASATYAERFLRRVRSKIKADGTDQTATLNAEIAALGSAGGILEVDTGTYVFTGTVLIPSRVGIVGAEIGGGSNGTFGTVFSHQPLVATPFLVYSPPTPADYCQNNVVRNLQIRGNGNGTKGLDARGAAYGVISDLSIESFEDNFLMSQTIAQTVERVRSQVGRISAFRIYGEGGTLISTSMTIRDCYFSQAFAAGYGPGYENSRPVIIDNDCCIGIIFDRCVFESTARGAQIGAGNIIEFRDLYTENIPADASAGRSIIDIGQTGPPANPANGGTYTFLGGSLAGANSGAFTDGQDIINVDYAHAVTVVGAALKRANSPLRTSPNTKQATFIGTTEVQIAKSLEVHPTAIKIGCTFPGGGRVTNSYEPVPGTFIYALDYGPSFTAFQPPALLKGPGGVVTFTAGVIAIGSPRDVGTRLTTFPVGHRPAKIIVVPVTTDTGDTGLIRILPDGGVTVASTLTGDYFAVPDVSFLAA